MFLSSIIPLPAASVFHDMVCMYQLTSNVGVFLGLLHHENLQYKPERREHSRHPSLISDPDENTSCYVTIR